MILSCSHICKSFVDKTILDDVSFHVEDREKAAIVGVNGAGKSTLLKIIMGELPPDSGAVSVAKGKTLGYLAQHQSLTEGRTIYEEMLEMKRDLLNMEDRLRELEALMKHADGEKLERMLEEYSRVSHTFEAQNGYAIRSEITGVLHGMGFVAEEFEKDCGTLSGGQKTRVTLCKLLLSKPDIILLDEPTNHLDMDSIAWLENFLLNYNGSVIVVSHDRYFLDRIVTRVIEIEHTHAVTYLGNYSAFSEKKKERYEAQLKAYLNQQREIKHQQEVITKLKQFNREKSIKRAESREKMLSKVELIDKPVTTDDAMMMELNPRVESGNDVLSIKGLKKSFGEQLLFSNVDIEIRKGERLAIIGRNGTGKTTLLKIINQQMAADAGQIRDGARVKIAYYDQEQQVLHDEKTLFDELSDEYPTLNNTEIRNVLAAFLFTGDDVFQEIGSLSGGERGRVSLAKLMLSEANFLILDEPTNHLDILSKEILEQALCRYTGTVLYVSHDRYFINQTATRILELENGSFFQYLGNYDYYLEKKAQLFGHIAEESQGKSKNGPEILSGYVGSAEKENKSSSQLDWKKQKELQAKKRKLQSDAEKAEKKIAELEERTSQIGEEMSDPDVATDAAKLQALAKEHAQIENELMELYSQWEQLTGELEELETE